MASYDLVSAWATRTRTHGRGSTRPILGRLIDQRPKAFLISTATRDRVWLPKRLVSHDPATGVFTVPSWLAEEKLLD